MGKEGGQPGQITHPWSRQLAGCDGASAPPTQSVGHPPTCAAQTSETSFDISRPGEPFFFCMGFIDKEISTRAKGLRTSCKHSLV